MTFHPIFSPFNERPKSQYFKNPLAVDHALFRDQLSLPTWLMLGALIQGLFSFLPYRNIALVAPAALYITYQLALVALRTFGILHNPLMDNVILGRTAPVFPTPGSKTAAQDTPAGTQVCAIMLAVRSNHPLGIFAPGFVETGDTFKAMCKQMEGDPTKYGYLGNSAWIAAMERTAANEFMSMVYFDSPESMHAFAHGPLHTETMEWWQRSTSKHKHLCVMHEVYACPKNGWEGVYVNYHPTGLGAVTVETEIEGKKVWVNPLVEGKGKLTYSRGRLGLPFSAKDWVPYEKTLSAQEKEGLYEA